MQIGTSLFSTGQTAPSGIPWSVSILSIGPQDGEDIPILYATPFASTCEVVLYLATEVAPSAADFNMGDTPRYVDLGQITLSSAGVGIELGLPDGLNGVYKIALLPVGGGDLDVVQSNSVALDTRTVVPPSGVNVSVLDVGDTGSIEQETVKTITFDMTSHNGSDDVLILMCIYHRLANRTIMNVTLDGNVAGSIFKQTGLSDDHTVLGYAIVPSANFADVSDFSVTFSGAVWRLSCVAYSIPAGSNVETLINQPETLRTGSDLGGSIIQGSAVILAQAQRNGIDLDPASWGDVTQDYKIDIQSNEWFHVAAGSNIQAASIFASPDGGVNVQTNGISIEVSA